MGENIFDSKSLDCLSLFKKIKSEEKEKEEITNLWMCYEDKIKKKMLVVVKKDEVGVKLVLNE